MAGLTGAMLKMKDAAREALKAQLSAALAEVDSNIERKRKQSATYGKGRELLGDAGLGPTLDDIDREAQVLDKQRSAIILQLRALAADRYEGFTGGETPKVPGTVPQGSAVLPEVEEAEDEKVARAKADLARNLHQLRLQQIEDETERELAAIKERYDHELAELERLAKEKGETVDQATLDMHWEARGLEYDSVHRKRQAEIDQADAEQARRNEELALQLKHEGRDLEREMLALEEERALAEAEKAGANLAAVREEYDLRRQIAERAAAAREEAGKRSRAAGTFSAYEVVGLGTRSLQERIASATERTAKAVERRQQDARYK